jgi:hypothetical protein
MYAKTLTASLTLSFVCLVNSAAFAQQLPKGTAISWIPPKEAIDIRDPQNPRITLPSGWKSCDEATGQPGFKQDRFIYGTSVASYIAHLKNKDQLFAGSATHGHGATMGDNNKVIGALEEGSTKSAADAYHSHPITVHDGPNIPPYVYAILLCKS